MPIRINLTLDEAIVVKNALMMFLQESPVKSRPEIQQILDARILHITMEKGNV